VNCTDQLALDRNRPADGSEAARFLDSKFYFGALGSGVAPSISSIRASFPRTASSPGAGRRPERASGTASISLFRVNAIPPHRLKSVAIANRGTLRRQRSWHAGRERRRGRRFGVAKSATLHPVRIGIDRGPIMESWAALGFDWVAANAVRPPSST